MMSHTKKNLKGKVWRHSFVHELSDADREKQKPACNELLRISNRIPARGKVMFSDECAIYRSSRAQNVYF